MVGSDVQKLRVLFYSRSDNFCQSPHRGLLNGKLGISVQALPVPTHCTLNRLRMRVSLLEVFPSPTSASHVYEKPLVSKSCCAMGRCSAMVVPSLRRWFRQDIRGLFGQHAKDSGCRDRRHLPLGIFFPLGLEHGGFFVRIAD